MKVRFLGTQVVKIEDKTHYKVNYSSDNTGASSFQTPEGKDAALDYSGEKMFSVGCDAAAIPHLRKQVPGEMVELVLTPDPRNPRFNICSGVAG